MAEAKCAYLKALRGFMSDNASFQNASTTAAGLSRVRRTDGHEPERMRATINRFMRMFRERNLQTPY